MRTFAPSDGLTLDGLKRAVSRVRAEDEIKSHGDIIATVDYFMRCKGWDMATLFAKVDTKASGRIRNARLRDVLVQLTAEAESIKWDERESYKEVQKSYQEIKLINSPKQTNNNSAVARRRLRAAGFAVMAAARLARETPTDG